MSRIFRAAAIVIGLILTITIPVQAQELRITNYNLNALQYWGTWVPYSYGELLKWEGYPSILDANYQKLKWVGNIRATTVADNKGLFWGECVSFAKALSKSNVATSNWKKGDKVMSYNLIQPGTVIATFGYSGYYGHVAIFKGYTYNNGRRNGILVWDQNYVSPHVVGKHSINDKGTTYPTDVNNANNYYTVII